ncbi:hypothetical protein [Moritella sp. F3]|uniref:hypothetical protein n=1 Tax=Moritella sp. F3 TaxID=2718882 RepID=UPI0018E1727C|nr:hypothetical protein [Moritella sp. F3]GIC79191.1 hypothetical protein FMO001_39180 [Moritella sp. F1]GIC83459.1 hypothetical protein FMO003_37390 [Moritella sp. F3]
MSVFNEAMQLKGQVEEDLFFAKLDLELIAALHKKHDKEQLQEYEEVETEYGYDR